MAKTVTMKQIPKDDLNEWGFPCSEKYIFRGYRNKSGVTRWELKE